jgi:DNA-binding IclR family transcriptional regulator
LTRRHLSLIIYEKIFFTCGLNVLEFLAEVSLKSIAERLSIPIPSRWRILGVLRDNGYLLFDRDRKTYGLGFKFLYLAVSS